MADALSFNKVVGDWIDDNTWPRASKTKETSRKSILVIDSKDAEKSGSKFSFQSAFGYIQISAKYDGSHSRKYLHDVQIKIVAPGKPDATVVATKDSYEVSDTSEEEITFDLGKIGEEGFLKGSVSFKTGDELEDEDENDDDEDDDEEEEDAEGEDAEDKEDGDEVKVKVKDNIKVLKVNGRFEEKKNIFATYKVTLPYAGDLEDTINIAPTKVSEATGFTKAQLRAIPTISAGKHWQPCFAKAVPAPAGKVTADQQLFVKFLKDFVVGNDSVVIETYYNDTTGFPEFPDANGLLRLARRDPSDIATAKVSPSSQWKATISFLGVLELVASVDPTTFTIAATLFVRVPIAGRVRLARVEGSLSKGATAKIKVIIAEGYARFTVRKNNRRQHVIYVEVELKIKYIGTIKTNSPEPIVTLPF